MAWSRSRNDRVFVGVTKIRGPAYTMRTSTIRMSRMIPMIMPAPNPPSPVVPPPGVLTSVCPMSAVLLSARADALRVRSVRSRHETSRLCATRPTPDPIGLEGPGELRWREEVGWRLPPLVDQAAARSGEQRGEGVRWLPACRGHDDDPAGG